MSPTRTAPVITAWAALVALTILSWQLADHHQTASGSLKLVSAVVTVVAFVKVFVVSQSFMELRRAAPVLQLVVLAWCLIVGTIVVVFLLAI
jgi:Prokaryotic Cytochrome C oxidase subunit IV